MGTHIKANFKDLQNFQNNMKKLNEQKQREFSEAALKEMAARLLQKVQLRTPVGNYSGKDYTGVDGRHIKGHKVLGKNGGTLRRGWSVGQVVREGDGYTIEIINPTEYAPYVEFGHRTADHKGWVAGYFMLTISEQELQQDAPRILLNKMKTFMGGVFNA